MASRVRILVLNPGSSSLKVSLVEEPGDRLLASAEADAPRAGTLPIVVAKVADRAPDAVGYRVVHGGADLVAPTLIDERTIAAIEALDELAPLHNRPAVDAIRAGRDLFPAVPHVACFDTAFHASLPAEAMRYALPAAWVERWGIRRFGFHGLSVTWAVERAAQLLGATGRRIVVAHLGSGCSVTAVDDRRSVATSMGFTPLEGLVMGTRGGSIDPGILLHLLRHGVAAAELEDGLAHRSGLLGLSGRTASARQLEADAAAGDDNAREALAIFARHAAEGIAAAASALDRLDALVFTGGIGENSAFMRGAICARLATLGVTVPVDAPTEDAVLSTPGGRVAVLRVASREELVIARAVAATHHAARRPARRSARSAR